MAKQDTYEYDVLASVFQRWWRGLNGLSLADGKPIAAGSAPKSPDRAALVELRRIDIVEDGGRSVVDIGHAMGVPAFQALLVAVRRSKLPRGSDARQRIESAELEPFAIAAATLARVRAESDSGETRRGATAELLGKGYPDEHVFAEPRFKRLIRCRDDWPGLMAQMRRVAAILERKAPVGDLGASIVLWNDDPRIRRDWAFAYYGRGDAQHGAAPAGDDDAGATDPRAPSVPTA